MARSSDKKINDLQGENSLLLNKLMKQLKGFVTQQSKGSGGGGGDSAKKERETQERASFKTVQQSVVTGYSKPGSEQVTGPFRFFGDLFDKIKPQDDEKAKAEKPKLPSWMKWIAAAGMILGGLWALIKGLMTDGPLKGFLALLAKGGILGGFKLMGSLIMAPIKRMGDAIRAMFSSGIVDDLIKMLPTKVVQLLTPVTNFFTKTIPGFFSKMFAPITKFLAGGGKGFLGMLGKAIGFIAKNIRFLPLIGALISWAFAISRFKSGDVIGGMIDVVAGFTSFLPLPISIPLGIGLGVLNAVLDAKSGGANKKAQGKKSDILKRMGKAVFGFVMKFPPFSTIYHLVKGIQAVVGGKWSAAANHFMWSIPLVGNLLEWFGVGFKDKTGKAEEIKGDKGSFWAKIFGFITKIPPLHNILSMGRGIAAIFKGDWTGAGKHFLYALPGVGWVLNWFGALEAPKRDAQGKIVQDKKTFWTYVKQLILGTSPISWIVATYKGIKYALQGKWALAGTSLVYGIPFLSTIIGWLGGPATAEAAVEDLGDKKGFFNKIKDYITSRFPIRNVLQFAGGIKKIFRGKIGGGLMDMAYSVPFLGTISKWLGGPASAEEATESLSDKKSFWSRVKQFIFGMSPISWIIGIYKGIKYAFQGQWKLAATSLAYGIPYVSTVISWMGGPTTAEEAVEDMGNKSGFFAKIKDWLGSRFPFYNIKKFVGGIKDIFSGNFKKGLLNMSLAIPGMSTLANFIYGEGAADKLEQAGKTGNTGGLFNEFKVKALRRVLKLVPKSILGISVRSRAAKLVSKMTGISVNDLLSEGDPDQDDATQGATATNIRDTGDSLGDATKKLSSAGKAVSSRSKLMEKEAGKFMQSSPGAWTILSKAGDEISKRSKMVVVSAFTFVAKLTSGLAFIALTGVTQYTKQLKAAIKIPVNSVIKAFRRFGRGLESRIGSELSIVTWRLRGRVAELGSVLVDIVSSPAKFIGNNIPRVMSSSVAFVGSILSMLTAATGITLFTGKTLQRLRSGDTTGMTRLKIALTHVKISSRMANDVYRILELLNTRLFNDIPAGTGSIAAAGRAQRQQLQKLRTEDNMAKSMDDAVKVQSDILNELKGGAIVSILKRIHEDWSMRTPDLAPIAVPKTMSGTNPNMSLGWNERSRQRPAGNTMP